jgi:hypothetical protein
MIHVGRPEVRVILLQLAFEKQEIKMMTDWTVSE